MIILKIRDLQKEYEDLLSTKEGLEEDVRSSETSEELRAANQELDEFIVEYEEVIAELKKIVDTININAIGIHESDMEEYAEDYVQGSYGVSPNSGLGLFVDYEKFAKYLASEMSSFKYDGSTYYYL